jgi:DNA (cytosine-5)-methyltransferase 1
MADRVVEGASPWKVVDLFSGAGGMSYGFHAHPSFAIAGAADAQIGKPSSTAGSLGCNASYAANIGVNPVMADLSAEEPSQVLNDMCLDGHPVSVLAACPPCTGFSRTSPANHLRDDSRNSLVGLVAKYVEILRPQVVLMENARELVMGRFSRHLRVLTEDLELLGYQVSATTHFLNEFGLPQRRERALVVAVAAGLTPRAIGDLWGARRVSPKATHVRRAIWELPMVAAGEVDREDPMHVAPGFGTVLNRRRLAAIPHDGGGWADLVSHPEAAELLTPAMAYRARIGDFGSHPDVYGRLWWDRPAVTVKRECAHVGNGRYAHPEQDRLCTVREMSILQGFPRTYQFAGSLPNMYRHVGDAVPPMFSFQLAWLASWILSGDKPHLEETILPDCHFSSSDLEPVRDT